MCVETTKPLVYFKAHIIADSNPTSPREWYNLGTMLCAHGRYNLGDDKLDFSRFACEQLESFSLEQLRAIVLYLIKSDSYVKSYYWQFARDTADYDKVDRYRDFIDREFSNGMNSLDWRAFMEQFEKSAIVLPLYLYDHSGITMRVSDFGDRWDSGQVGIIFATHDKIRECFMVSGELSADTMQRAEQCLRGEVETYDQYLTGDVYGYTIERVDLESGESDIVDSCWGFYGQNPDENGMTDHVSDEFAELLRHCEVEYPR